MARSFTLLLIFSTNRDVEHGLVGEQCSPFPLEGKRTSSNALLIYKQSTLMQHIEAIAESHQEVIYFTIPQSQSTLTCSSWTHYH